MGYNSRLKGVITLTPPLTTEQALKIGEAIKYNSGQDDWTLSESLDAICPVHDGEQKHYYAEEGLRWWLTQLPEGTIAAGAIREEGEDSDDISVLTVLDGKVTREVALIIESPTRFRAYLAETLSNYAGPLSEPNITEVLEKAFAAYEAPEPSTPDHLGYLPDWAAEQRETMDREQDEDPAQDEE